jgi:L-ascorbate metabolism protein UlaG (beta-lactamase superfamily)
VTEKMQKMANIVFYGHSCFEVELGGKNILFDPFITDNPLANEISLNQIHPDYVLVSHAHGDHTGDLLHFAQKGSVVVAIHEICEWVGKQGNSVYHPMNIGGKKSFDFGEVHMVQAIHSSSFPDGTYGGLAAGFVVKSSAVCFYFAGDTAVYSDMALLAEEYIFDFVVLPIGDNYTMGIDGAIKAAKLLQCKKVMGVHYNTFGYIMIDAEEAINKFKSEGIELILPQLNTKYTV